jgi:hypothetical protein
MLKAGENAGTLVRRSWIKLKNPLRRMALFFAEPALASKAKIF